MLIKWQKEVPTVYKGYILRCMCLKTEVIKNNQLQGQKENINAKIHPYKVFQGLTVSYCN